MSLVYTFKRFWSFLRLDELVSAALSGDDDWDYSEEPHTSRRSEILRKHPEIKRLMGYDPFIAYVLAFEVSLQLFMAWCVRDSPWWLVVLLAYCVGAFVNHSCGTAIHEIGHNLAFGHSRPILNRLLGMFANLPLAVPFSVTYKKYHSDHHRYMGHEWMDVDIPTRLESRLFQHPITKIIWLFFHPAIHALRPMYKSPKNLTKLEITNVLVQCSWNLLIYHYLGGKSLAYLALGTLFGFGCHPCAGHFISEHYLFQGTQATHSYYGPMNAILFNVGYHVEHHDFPYIPYRRLPRLKEIAPEYYADLPYHTSWCKVLWDFIFQSHMGPMAHGVGMEGGFKPANEKDEKVKEKCPDFAGFVKQNGHNQPFVNGHDQPIACRTRKAKATLTH